MVVVLDTRTPALVQFDNAGSADCGLVTLTLGQSPPTKHQEQVFFFKHGGLITFRTILEASQSCQMAEKPVSRPAVRFPQSSSPPISRRLRHARRESEDLRAQWRSASPSSLLLPDQHLSETEALLVPGATTTENDSEVFGQALTLETYQSFLDAEGRIEDWDALRKLVFFRGIHPLARKEVQIQQSSS